MIKQIREENYKCYLAAIVAIITFAVYLPALRNGFVNWDDDVYIYNNLHIRFLNMEFFRWAFLDFYAGNWHPLTWISHAADYAIWGLDPTGHHLTNNILHAVNAFVVVLLVIKLLTGRHAGKLTSSLDTRFTLIAAGATGLLFGLHPLHVESVAWVSERKDLLCALFFLLSIIAYIEYVTDITPPSPSGDNPSFTSPYLKGRTGGVKRGWRSRGRYFLSLIFFILALLSKPMAVTLPAVLLILDWHPLQRIRSLKLFREAFVEKLPFVVLSLISAAVTLRAQKSGGAIMPLELYPLSARVLVGVKSVVIYLCKLVLPVRLLPYYSYPSHVSILSFEYLMPVVLVAAMTTGCIFISKKRPVWASVWAYYLILLIPVLGIVQVGNQAMADRYIYLPGLGPFLLTGLAAAWVWAKSDYLNKWGAVAKGAFAVMSISLVMSLACFTVNQIAIWKDSLTLWTYVIEKGPDRSSTSYINRGLAYREAGQPDLALDDFNAAIALEPDAADAYNNRAIVLKEAGKFDQAIADYSISITINPTRYATFYNRGTTFKETGRYDLAMDDFNKAITLNPSYANVYVNRGLIFEQTGQPERAREDFDSAIRLDPSNAEAYNNRGLAFEEMGRLDRAIEDYSKAIRLNSSGHIAYSNRGIAFSKMGRVDDAMRDFRKACELGSEVGCEALRTYKMQ